MQQCNRVGIPVSQQDPGLDCRRIAELQHQPRPQDTQLRLGQLSSNTAYENGQAPAWQEVKL